MIFLPSFATFDVARARVLTFNLGGAATRKGRGPEAPQVASTLRTSDLGEEFHTFLKAIDVRGKGDMGDRSLGTPNKKVYRHESSL